MKSVILVLVYGLQLYIVTGFILALIVQKSGLKKIDASVEGAGAWFRIITFPGIVALWPMILMKWIRSAKSDS